MSSPAVTVHCDAESHDPWQRRYTRGDDDVWVPDVVDHFGEPRPLDEHLGDRARKSRRDGGMRLTNAGGRPVPIWDSGRSLKDAAERLNPALDRARAVAGVGPAEPIDFARSYLLRCPGCGDTLKRSGTRLSKQFNWAVSEGITRVTLPMLRQLDTLIDDLDGG